MNAGYSKLFIVFDRGYYSEEDVEGIEQLDEIGFGILCPDGTNWVEDLIRTRGLQIKDQQKHYIASENIYGNIYEVQPFKENGNDKTYYAYLFYDSSRADDERRTIHEVFRRNWDRANERKRYSEKMETEFAKQAIIVAKLDKTNKEGKNFQLLEDTQMIQSLLDMRGFFVMLSPSKLLPAEAIKIIRKRDVSEKGFATMMNHFDLRTTNRHTSETYDGLMFVAFIALVCLSAFRYYERSVLHKTTSTSVATTFSELTKYQIRKNTDGNNWEPGFAMSKDQKAIFEKLGLSETDVQVKVADVKIKN